MPQKAILLILLLAIPILADTLVRPEGTAVTYYLSRPQRETYPMVVILQGSECIRVSDKFESYAEVLVAQGVACLRVEKPGLHSGVAVGECPDEYLRLNTPQRRVLDLLLVIAELRRDSAWDGRLVLMGGSEGAMIAAMAAPLVPETRGVVLLSGGGGLTFGEEVVQSASAQMLESGMPHEKVEQEADAMRQFMTTFAKDPTPYKEWGSDGRLARNTHLWWAHAVNLRLSTPLLQTPAPLLILHGRSDQGTPYRSAELLLQTLTFSHKTNLEFRPYSGGHSPPEEEVLKAVEWAVERF